MVDFILSRPELIWFVIGFILFVLELVMPGFVIFFFGIGAWVTSLMCLIFEPGINLQVFVFILFSVIALITLRKSLAKKFFASKDVPGMDMDDDFTGNTALALNSFGPGETGRVEYRGSSWQASSTSAIKKGQEVVIKSKKNIKLIVEPK